MLDCCNLRNIGSADSEKGQNMEIRVDVDRLRDYMQDECGTAAFNGFPTAMVDEWEIERMDGYELCRKAEQMGVDLREFQAR